MRDLTNPYFKTVVETNQQFMNEKQMLKLANLDLQLWFDHLKTDFDKQGLELDRLKQAYTSITDEEIDYISMEVEVDDMGCHADTWHIRFARAVLAHVARGAI